MTQSPSYAILKTRALIALGGPDWRSFLQGLITQDVETLAPREIRFAGLLTPQGRLMFDMFVVGRDDLDPPGGCWLDVEAERRTAIIQRLSLYRLRAKVEIAADETPVAALFPATAGGAGLWATDPRLPDLGLRGYGASPPPGATPAEEAAYDAWRLALGAPGPADWGFESTYPIEANFDLLSGIDFRKGCFVGQETTSRMKRRGQVKNRMLPIVFEGAPPARGAEILTGERRAGQVLSVGDGRAMALLRLDRIEAGGLTVDGRPIAVERPAWIGTTS